MSINSNNNKYEEPEDFKQTFDEANQIEHLVDYEPNPDYEPSGQETQFDFPLELEGIAEGGAIRNIRSKGETRTSIQITMSSKLRDQWYEFVEGLTSNKISPGRTSASAPLVTLGMRLLMALVAEFEVQSTLADLQEILGTDGDTRLKRMLEFLLENIENEPL